MMKNDKIDKNEKIDKNDYHWKTIKLKKMINYRYRMNWLNDDNGRFGIIFIKKWDFESEMNFVRII